MLALSAYAARRNLAIRNSEFKLARDVCPSLKFTQSVRRSFYLRVVWPIRSSFYKVKGSIAIRWQQDPLDIDWKINNSRQCVIGKLREGHLRISENKVQTTLSRQVSYIKQKVSNFSVNGVKFHFVPSNTWLIFTDLWTNVIAEKLINWKCVPWSSTLWRVYRQKIFILMQNTLSSFSLDQALWAYSFFNSHPDRCKDL